MNEKLTRKLGFLDVFCIAAGAMISSGIFILPGIAFGHAGPLVSLSYLFAGFLALLGTLSIVELSTAMPKAGGDYFFITRSFGPIAGTISGLLSWSALCLKTAFAIFGIAEIMFLFAGIPILISAAVICVIFAGLNILGVKEASRLEVVLVIGLFILMTIFIVAGAPSFDESHFIPLFPKGFNRVIATAGFVFVSFGGLLNIATISGEVKNPSKNIPRAMISSVVIVTLFYALLLLITVGVLPAEKLNSSLTPIADTARIFLGTPGFIAISIAALLAFITTANAGMLSASRYPLALSTDRLLPKFIGSKTKKSDSPFVAISVTAAFIFSTLLLDLETLVESGSVVILTMYIFTNIAVIILRESRVQNYRPSFKVPFYPWLQIISIALFILLIVDLGFVAVEISLIAICTGLIIFFIYGKRHHNVEYALLHIVERIMNKELTGHMLENELKEILIQRDEILVDRFHLLVENSRVLDIKDEIGKDDLFKGVVNILGSDLKMDEHELYELLKRHEEGATSVINPFIAIPHIIIPGRHKFAMAVVRSIKGVKFSTEDDSVKAIFVLAGTKDERNFHLKTLAAIAQITQNRKFEKRWLEAKTEAQLKDILLLSRRRRNND